MNKLALLIPLFLLLAFLEWMLTRNQGARSFTRQNSLMNVCIGAIDQVVSLGHLWLFYTVLLYMYDHYRIWTPEVNWIQWVAAYLAVDFVSYWYHRFSHRMAILWCGHVTHHSAGFFNLTNGFRTSPFQGLNRIVFWAALPVAGFKPEVLLATFIVSGLYDFFLHTQHFPKIKWVEYVLITPSLHKVHHGKNPIYIDKNYGSTLVVWDRLFGTFQDETEPVEYGILSREYTDDDPVNAILYHYRYILRIMKRTQSWKNKLLILVMPPDWLPDDLRMSDAVKVYSLPIALGQQWIFYGVTHLILCAIGVLAILVFRSQIPVPLFVASAFLFLSGMVTGTRIYSKSIKGNVGRKETLRLCITLGAFAVFLLFYQVDLLFVLYVAAVGFSALLVVWSLQSQQKQVNPVIVSKASQYSRTADHSVVHLQDETFQEEVLCEPESERH